MLWEYNTRLLRSVQSWGEIVPLIFNNKLLNSCVCQDYDTC